MAPHFVLIHHFFQTIGAYSVVFSADTRVQDGVAATREKMAANRRNRAIEMLEASMAPKPSSSVGRGGSGGAMGGRDRASRDMHSATKTQSPAAGGRGGNVGGNRTPARDALNGAGVSGGTASTPGMRSIYAQIDEDGRHVSRVRVRMSVYANDETTSLVGSSLVVTSDY